MKILAREIGGPMANVFDLEHCASMFLFGGNRGIGLAVRPFCWSLVVLGVSQVADML